MVHDATLRRSADTTQRSTVARILRYWDRATEAQREAGAQWYPLRNGEACQLAGDHGTTVETVAAVMAHLSPRTTWARNLAGAQAMVAGLPYGGLIPDNVTRARHAMSHPTPLSTLNGPKVRAFAANILLDDEAVTVDVWGMRIALGRDTEEKVLARKGVYDAIAHCYRLAARRVGVSPSTMQAATWIVARNGRAS